MENYSKIHEADLSTLEQMISIYPWYQEARVELIFKLAQISREAALEKLKEFYSFIPYPDWVANRIEKIVNGGELSLNDQVIKSEIQSARKIFVVGGDYFSKDELASVRESDVDTDNSAPKIPMNEADSIEQDIKERKISEKKEINPLIFYTETLAQIYTQQECWNEALDVYSKLILLYPEKSVYFASLIDDIKVKMSGIE